ncbi:uncharacterized protein DAT39_018754, partial [Clarias magur]
PSLEERVQLMEHTSSETSPTEEEPFPQLTITPSLEGYGGPLLDEEDMNFETVS